MVNTRGFLLLFCLIGGFFLSPTNTEAQGDATVPFSGK